MHNRLKMRQALVEALLKSPDMSLRRVRRRMGISARQTRIASREAKAIRKAATA